MSPWIGLLAFAVIMLWAGMTEFANAGINRNPVRVLFGATACCSSAMFFLAALGIVNALVGVIGFAGLAVYTLGLFYDIHDHRAAPKAVEVVEWLANRFRQLAVQGSNKNLRSDRPSRIRPVGRTVRERSSKRNHPWTGTG